MNNKLFGLLTMIVFATIGIGAFVGMFWNPYQIIIFVIGLIGFVAGYNEYKKSV